jgi:hypothetical protein
MTAKALLASAILAIATAGGAGGAQALCAEPNGPDTGTYVNVDPDTRSITRMEIGFRCGATTRRRGETTTRRFGADPHWTVRLWGACSPSDCDWGRTRAEMRQRGSHLAAHYDQGFAERRVRIEPAGGSRLRLVVRSSYDGDRRDRTFTAVMRPR